MVGAATNHLSSALLPSLGTVSILVCTVLLNCFLSLTMHRIQPFPVHYETLPHPTSTPFCFPLLLSSTSSPFIVLSVLLCSRLKPCTLSVALQQLSLCPLPPLPLGLHTNSCPILNPCDSVTPLSFLSFPPNSTTHLYKYTFYFLCLGLLDAL